MIYILIIISAGLVCSLFLTRLDDKSDSKAWDSYRRNETSQAQQILSRAARPLASIPALQKQIKSTGTYRALEAKLRAGGAYAGSLEVFLAVQVLVIIVGLAILGSLLVLNIQGAWFYMGAIFSILLIFLPYNTVNTKAKERAAAVSDSLPDFAELLSMVLPNSSILSGMAFTAERSSGPVADEVKAMVTAISTRTLNEAEAFQLAAERLGTAEARAFMTTLMNAYLEGTKALDAINAQAESMRKISFQNRREAAKKLPTKLILIFGAHFMPALLVVAFLPLALGIGNALG